MPKISITDQKRLEEKQYRICGNHSAVQLCSWTKKSLVDKGVCYKEYFYGVDCHRCSQMSPSALYCNHNCIFCWRPMEYMGPNEFKEYDEPQEIIDSCVKRKRELLSGYPGNPKANQKKVREALDLFPSHWAISLSGEPTLYPKLGEMIDALKANPEVRSVFVVTNGEEPQVLKKLMENNQLPHQLYISVESAFLNKYLQICQPVLKDGWQRLNQSLSLIEQITKKARVVLRITMIKGLNDSEKDAKGFAELIDRYKPDFVEIKAYMFLGYSRKRLKIENMPIHEEVKKFSNKILGYSQEFRYESEYVASRIVLLKRRDCEKPTRVFQKQ